MADQITPSLRTAQLICGALMFGVIAFWAIVFVLNAGEGGFADGLNIDPRVMLAIVIAVALSAFAAALAFRSRALSPDPDASRRDPAAAHPNAARLQTNLIIAWALLEGQALVAGVFFLLTGSANLLIISALVFVIGFAVTFPRAEWFERASRTSAPPS